MGAEVALATTAIGAGLSVYQGIQQNVASKAQADTTRSYGQIQQAAQEDAQLHSRAAASNQGTCRHVRGVGPHVSSIDAAARA